MLVPLACYFLDPTQPARGRVDTTRSRVFGAKIIQTLSDLAFSRQGRCRICTSHVNRYVVCKAPTLKAGKTPYPLDTACRHYCVARNSIEVPGQFHILDGAERVKSQPRLRVAVQLVA